MGLSPRYLFELECFTQTLPDSQADLLWDNVQFLNDSEMETESESNDSPQVFLLSGWGEPGSALSDDDDNKDKDSDRRFWTCWCAAHRPPTAPLSKEKKAAPRSMIILEFELERDLYNPLHPPFQMSYMSSNSPESQASSYGSGISSGSSTATTFSRGSGSTTEMNVPFPGMETTSLPQTGEGEAPGRANRPSSSAPQPASNILTNPAELFLSKQDLEGDSNWFPSPEDVFESTTSHSKPLKALERMRRINRTFTSMGPDRSAGQHMAGDDPAANASRQRARARRGGSQAGVGTMDIFAVLAQVNDQLSSAPDVESFLKVVVGVIKDLTQFHRVLIYQFDETCAFAGYAHCVVYILIIRFSWNGQVVAELVDWRQTHDLYKGLHFPASDIPAQVCPLI